MRMERNVSESQNRTVNTRDASGKRDWCQECKEFRQKIETRWAEMIQIPSQKKTRGGWHLQTITKKDCKIHGNGFEVQLKPVKTMTFQFVISFTLNWDNFFLEFFFIKSHKMDERCLFSKVTHKSQMSLQPVILSLSLWHDFKLQFYAVWHHGNNNPVRTIKRVI